MIEIYKKRAMWSESFFRGVFLAGMCTTQRAESINSLMKLYLKRDFPMIEFMKQFHHALQRIRSNFIDNQIDAEIWKPVVRHGSALINLEEHAAMLCTKKIFMEVRKNISKEQSLICEGVIKLGEQNHIYIFRVYKRSVEKICRVQIDMGSASFRCDCMMLECTGIPCEQSFQVLSRWVL